MDFPYLNLWFPGDVAPFDRPNLTRTSTGKMRGYYAPRKNRSKKKHYGRWKQDIARSLAQWKRENPKWLEAFPGTYRHKQKTALSNVTLLLRFHASLHGRADGTNGAKAIEDALVNAGIICDDNVTRLPQECWEFSRELYRGKIGTRVLILPNEFGSLFDVILDAVIKPRCT